MHLLADGLCIDVKSSLIMNNIYIDNKFNLYLVVILHIQYVCNL